MEQQKKNTTKAGWMKSNEEIAMLLTLKNARSAAQGRPCPVAAKVVARLEAAVEAAKAARRG
jgi:hypothetical protein